MRRPWTIVVGCFIGLAVSASPTYFDCFGIYLKPMVAEFGWSRTQISLGFSMVSLTSVLLTPIAGIGLDRFGSRTMILAGCLLLPLVLIGFSFLPSYGAFVALSLMMGLTFSVSSPSAFLTVPPQWFDRHLGLTIALSVMGLGAGQALLPLLTQHFVAGLGWRGAWLGMAGVVGIIGVVNCLALVRDNPSLLEARRLRGESDLLTGHTLGEAARAPVFWILVTSFILVVLVSAGTRIHLSALMTDRGFSAAQGAAAVATMGFASIAARLITGLLLDRVPFGYVGALFFVGEAAGVLLLASGQGDHMPFIAAAMIGAAQGSEGDIIPYVLRRKFGLRAFGKIYGLCFGLYQIGPVIGPLLMALAYDRIGSYEPTLVGFAALSIIASLLILVVGSRRVPMVQVRDSAARVGD